MTIDDPDREARRVHEKLPAGELPPDDRGQDPVREAFEEGMSLGESRPLTRDEREAAEHDKGFTEPVYAPASERVPKPPAPGDDQFIHRHPDAEPPPPAEKPA